MDWRDAEREYDDEVTGETTLGRLFEDAADRFPDRPAQRYKGGVYDRSLAPDIVPAAEIGEFRALTYAEMRQIVRHLAAGFRDLGVDRGDRVAIFANTRMEWAQTDFALLSAGAVVTTIYPKSSTDNVRYLLDDPDADGVVVENEALLEQVLAVEDDLDLEFIVSMDGVDGYGDRDDVLTLADVHDRGAAAFDEPTYQEWVDAPAMDDVASLIYTSGTTGKPKGVKLTHRNFRSNVSQIRRRYGPRPDKPDGIPVIDETTRVVSYLPLAHVFERTAGHFLLFASGGSVAYAENPDTLRDDFALVSPTTATSVPRVYEKIYDAAREQASGSRIKRRIFRWAVRTGATYQRTDDPDRGLRIKQRLADRLVFKSIREALGGEIELLISGGGSLSADLCTLYHGMGLPIYEGYGLTETAPVVAANPTEAPEIGTIGPSLPGVEIRIDESVVTQSSFEDDEGDVGELLVRGPNVTDGYWNKPRKTERAFVEADDGGRPWFRTGDIVHRRPDDYLEFRERLKRILVLSTGKNVAPGPIEDAFAASEVVEQCLVVGDGEKFVGALLVPNTDHIRKWLSGVGLDIPDNPEAFVDNEHVRTYVSKEVDKINEGFEPHEQIKQFRLLPEEFTEENEMLTPTMKKKRRVILDRYDDRVADMYAE
ncbi:long-chain fatty acid--CoA ligase [Halobacteria archaeon AArc-dxtr1]|nr:long-chain fatty acid--CoA ligase [Halobacteria archaeon AArc-dxtr1]